jgi:hypothetical protein
LPEDVSQLKDVSNDLECERIIIAGPSYVDENRDGPLEATFMLCKSIWNGVNYMDIDWDGKLGSFLEKFKEKISDYSESYQQKIKPENDWLVVTVDYHS